MNFTEGFHKLSYLLNYDLMNKYSLKNYYNIPRLSSIKLKINLKELDFLLNQEQNSNSNKVKLFVFFYLIFLSTPHLKTFLVKKKKDKKEYQLEEENDVLNFVISNKKDIHNFLINTLLNVFRAENDKNVKYILRTKKDFLTANLKVRLANIPELQYLLDFYFPAVVLREESLDLSLLINMKKNKMEDKGNILKNLLFLCFS